MDKDEVMKQVKASFTFSFSMLHHLHNKEDLDKAQQIQVEIIEYLEKNLK